MKRRDRTGVDDRDATRLRDRGGGGVVMIVTVAVMLVLVVSAVGVTGVRLVERQRAQNAADAAALAGVQSGRDVAERIADQNGGAIVDYHESGGQVTVTVSVGGQRASARAIAGP